MASLGFVRDSKFARVCSYDRAGMAWSAPGVQPRTSQQIVKELHTLLGNAGVQAPYVLVGHSLAGINMQLYASQYPNEVAGMVLVDSSHENQFSRKELPQIPSFFPMLIKVLTPFIEGETNHRGEERTLHPVLPTRIGDRCYPPGRGSDTPTMSMRHQRRG
jgi:pimeloyl-ACP methyl ester carboxylesterase